MVPVGIVKQIGIGETLNMENKNEKLILPMAKPILTTFPMDANAISIISNTKEAYPWILNHFIQIVSWRRVKLPWELDVFYSDSFKFHKKCPFLDCQRIKKHFIEEKWDNIKEFIIDSINHGYYVYLVVNTLYISAYEPKRESDSPHDILIYGYDAMQKKFYIADSLKYGKYSFETCSYAELENAFYYLKEENENYSGFSNSIELFSHKKTKAGHFDLNKVVDGLKAYLSSQAFDERANPDFLYGINVYDNYKLYLSLLLNDEVQFVITPLHAFWEHKSVMMLRLEYMVENDMLRNEENLLGAYKEVEQKTLFYRTLIMKYFFNKNKDLLQDVLEEIDEIKNKESLVLERVLANITVSVPHDQSSK